ncbi:MAG: hypothetical protein IPQ09_06775 [Myxococcales bacterium]|nr:hypothetical protein [Myxococcales bacterium]
MAEDKKPKIDLKARLGKSAGAATPPPAAPGAIPVPVPGGAVPPPSVPAPAAMPGVAAPAPAPKPAAGSPIAPPPGFVDPSIAAAAAAAAAAAHAARPPEPVQPQRIEVDEAAVQEAAKGGTKKGVMIGGVLAVILGLVGYVAGMSGEASSGRKKAQADALSLAGDIDKSKDTLDKLAKKLEEGKKALITDKKFPDKLAGELGGMNVDFDGGKLAGVRFSGFSADTTSGLIEFITAVQSLNDRKLVIINLLNALQKPITEGFQQADKPSLGFVVLLGRQDPAKNYYGILAPLDAPLAITPPNISLPDKFKAIDVTAGQKVEVPKYSGGDLSKPAALYIAPASITKNFPSEVTGKIAQLVSQLGRVASDINGEKPQENVVTEAKPGMVQRADKLSTALKKVSSGGK